MNILTFLEKYSPRSWVLVGGFLIAFVGWIDYSTGPEISFSFFYLIPILMLTWYAGRWPGIGTSLLAASIWLVIDLATRNTHSHPLIPYWNGAIRLGFFLVVTLLLTLLKQSLQRHKDLARMDFLTGAFNARIFSELLQMEIDRCQRFCRPFSLTYIDADHFKAVNDRYGHQAGDTALRVIANTMHKNLRKTDLVARLGGDEFALLLPETDPEAAKTVVAKLSEYLLEEMRRNDWPITFSMGVMTFMMAPASVDEAIHLVDGLMYAAKNGGKNTVRYAIWGNGGSSVVSKNTAQQAK